MQSLASLRPTPEALQTTFCAIRKLKQARYGTITLEQILDTCKQSELALKMRIPNTLHFDLEYVKVLTPNDSFGISKTTLKTLKIINISELNQINSYHIS